MTIATWKKLEIVYRRTTVCSHRKASHEAIAVVSSLTPLKTLVKYRANKYDRKEGRRVKKVYGMNSKKTGVVPLEESGLKV